VSLTSQNCHAVRSSCMILPTKSRTKSQGTNSHLGQGIGRVDYPRRMNDQPTNMINPGSGRKNTSPEHLQVL
jgi:hypothetical protein